MLAVQSFLLVFSALFSIVNPIATALIFSQVTVGFTHGERAQLARRIGTYAAAVMLVSLWAGSYVLSFFGISLAALRIAGGLVVAVRAWKLLSTPEQTEERKQEQAGQAAGSPDIAFFPLTMPLTTGPGTISVAVALGSNRPPPGPALWAFFSGASLATLAIAAIVWLAYGWADLPVALLGPAGARVLTRLAAFLLLCIGTEIILNGATDVLDHVRWAGRG